MEEIKDSLNKTQIKLEDTLTEVNSTIYLKPELPEQIW